MKRQTSWYIASLFIIMTGIIGLVNGKTILKYDGYTEISPEFSLFFILLGSVMFLLTYLFYRRK